MTSHLTTHVLDAATGTPATALAISLTRHLDNGAAPAHAETVAEGFTDGDGRLALGPERLAAGMYSLAFATGAWFADRGIRSFYPLVTVTFSVEDTDRHYHVPLLLSPYAYSTYRGS